LTPRATARARPSPVRGRADQNRALELRETRLTGVSHQPARARGGGIGPCVVERAERPAFAIGDRCERVEQVARRSREPVEACHHQHVADVELGRSHGEAARGWSWLRSPLRGTPCPAPVFSSKAADLERSHFGRPSRTRAIGRISWVTYGSNFMQRKSRVAFQELNLSCIIFDFCNRRPARGGYVPYGRAGKSFHLFFTVRRKNYFTTRCCATC